MSSKKTSRKREQKPKATANRAMNQAMQELRRSSATERHKSVKDYRRKPKHAGRGWE